MKKRFENRSHSTFAPPPARCGTLPMRLGALTLASTLLWSLGLAGAARAVTYRPPVAPGHARALTPAEMTAITGAQGVGGGGLSSGSSAAADGPGGSYPWEGGGIKSSGGAMGATGSTNTANGNKTTSLTLVGWTARGGLPVAFTLTHNSQSARSGDLGHKWTCSYDISLTSLTGSPVVHWGDDRAETYTVGGGSYAPPVGIHDALVANVDGTWTLTKTDQTCYHFDTGGYCDAVSDENGNTVTIHRNTSHFVTSIVDANSRTITLGYDTSSRISTVTDPLSRVWTLHYSSGSDLTGVDWPALSSTTYSVSYGYNANHDITGVTDLRGNSRSLTYNSDDSLATEADNAGNATSYSYTSSATTVTDANSHATVYTYSGGKLTSVTDPASHSENYAYDTNNNKTQVQDKRGKYWNYTYNSGGDLLTATDPLSHTTTFTYNGHHKPLTVTRAGGESVAMTYDSDDNLTQVDQKDALADILATTTYTIGSYGLVSAKEDSNSHTTYYGYDTDGDLANVTTPLGHETQWGHDALGAVTSRTDAMSRETDYTRDAWERVTTVTYPDSSTHTFTYDADSNLTQFTDATGTTARAYDVDNRMTGESKGGSTTVSHTYDATGKKGLLSTTTDSNGRTITYAYTSRDQLSTVAESGTGAPSGTTTYTYDNGGLETGIANANGTTAAKVYDDAGRLTSVINKDASSTTLSSFAYTYNSDDLKTSCTEASGDVVTYDYDPLMHLCTDSRTGTYSYVNAYTVDGEGNRTDETVGGTITSFTYDSDDELTAASGGINKTYTYNANGDQTNVTTSYEGYSLVSPRSYDYDDQMIQSGSYPNNSAMTHDALGRMVGHSVYRSPDVTTLQYDGDEVLVEKDGTTTTASYAYGNALLRKDSVTPLFDGLGSERTETDSSGGVTYSRTSDAFGNHVAGSGSPASLYQFGATSGYRNDGDGAVVGPAGLVKVGCREYDPEVGRFTSRDTDLSQSAYVYCDGDPVNATDPSGHLPRWLRRFLHRAGAVEEMIGEVELVGGIYYTFIAPGPFKLCGVAVAIVGLGDIGTGLFLQGL